MSLFTTPYTFSSGTTIQSAQANANFAYIASFFNTPSITNANIAVGAAIAPTKLDLTVEIPVLRATGQNCLSAGVTGDTIPRIAMTSDLGIQFGPGGSGALDLSIQRISSSLLGVFDATTTLKSLAMNSIYLKTATNYLIHTPATIATSARTVTHPDPGANVDLVYKTSGATATLGGIAYGAAAHTLNFSSAGTAGQVCLSGGAGSPTFGTLGTKYGGTNIDASAAANGKIFIGNGSGLTLANISAGTGIAINNSAGGIEVAATGAVAFTFSAKGASFETTDASGTFYQVSATATITLDAGKAVGTIFKFQRTVATAILTFIPEGGSGETMRAGSQYGLTSITWDNDGCLEAVKTATGYTFS